MQLRLVSFQLWKVSDTTSRYHSQAWTEFPSLVALRSWSTVRGCRTPRHLSLDYSRTQTWEAHSRAVPPRHVSILLSISMPAIYFQLESKNKYRGYRFQLAYRWWQIQIHFALAHADPLDIFVTFRLLGVVQLWDVTPWLRLNDPADQDTEVRGN